MPEGRTKQLVIYAVNQLRANQALAGYVGDVQKINVGMLPEQVDGPLGIGVDVISSGGNPRGNGTRERWTVQANVVATAQWVETNGQLALYDVLDECDTVLTTSFMPGLVPLGPVGSQNALSVQDGAQFVMPGRWQFQRTILDHQR